MGLESVASTADPHAYSHVDGRTLAFHQFDPLVANDTHLQPVPALAASWSVENELRWTFNIRPGVRFHNGKELTATDAVYSLCRIAHLPGSGLLGSLQGIASATAKDRLTLVVETDVPAPLLARNLANIAIIASPPGWEGQYHPDGCGTGPWPDGASFDKGQVAGTGPYRLKSFTRNGETTLARFDGYWGEVPAWETVTMLPFPDPGARNRSLVRGMVDLVNQVSAESMAFLSEQSRLRVEASTRARSIFIGVNLSPGTTTGKDGGNPLSDVRVRQAISLAIDRKALSDRLMPGMSGPAYQFMPEGMLGYDPGATSPFNIAQARKLLAEAGFANGFDTTLTAVEPFARVAEGVSRYLAAVGIRVQIRFVRPGEVVDIMSRRDYALVLVSSVPLTGEFSTIAREVFAPMDPASGMGMQNFGGYFNDQMNVLIMKALATTDTEVRGRLLQQITAIGLQDLPFIPLLHVSRAWAMRKDLRFQARADGHTLAQHVRPAE
ncbi:hypothetical protein HHL28_08130 [Aerophototrophica crusticola]|uniref:Solute-binding protein family 5 domain-containing protein n=1 Tax=Aerophototrophica crusticola TaxID=1709002 RepID=A0A858R6P0_9PROT|nr:hypothetical protein HHL28_08130 [Rhodospirillaceae bacterium B3]